MARTIKIITELVIDDECGAAYLYLQPERKGESGAVVNSVPVPEDDDMVLDLDSEGKVFGIEFLEAAIYLPQSLLNPEVKLTPMAEVPLTVCSADTVGYGGEPK